MEIKTAQMEKVIKIIGVIGDGTEKNPAHRIFVYYTLDGSWNKKLYLSTNPSLAR